MQNLENKHYRLKINLQLNKNLSFSIRETNQNHLSKTVSSLLIKINNNSNLLNSNHLQGKEVTQSKIHKSLHNIRL